MAFWRTTIFLLIFWKKKKKFRQGWQVIYMPAINWREVSESSQYLPLVFLIFSFFPDLFLFMIYMYLTNNEL